MGEKKYLDSMGLIRLVANIKNELSTKADIDYVGSPVSKEELLLHVKEELLSSMYPVGSIYISTSSISPGSLFGGEAEHALTVEEMPSHSHIYKRHTFNRNDTDPTTGEDVYGANNKTLDAHEGTTASSGGGQPHNNMPPYFAVYMWQRIG